MSAIKKSAGLATGRDLMASILYDIRAHLAVASGCLKVILKEWSKLSPEAVALLNRWQPQIERWRGVEASVRQCCVSRTGPKPDLSNLAARLCHELADVEIARAEMELLFKETPEGSESYTSKMVRSLTYLEKLRQSLVDGEFNK